MSTDNLVLGSERQGRGRRRSWLSILLVIALVLIGAVVVLAAAGVLALVPTSVTTTIDPDASPRAVWQAQGIDHYRYTLQVSCFCLTDMTRPVTIEVRDGQVVSLTYADDGTAANAELFASYSTAEGLFTIIEEAEAEGAVRLDVVYNEAGFPISINIDISELMADEELYLTIAEFERL
jgi:hypothetical protein